MCERAGNAMEEGERRKNIDRLQFRRNAGDSDLNREKSRSGLVGKEPG